MRRIVWTCLALAVSTPATARAQDTRTVTEPHIPAACVAVTAELIPVADTTLADADEGKLDTKRIQSAIDHCTAGPAPSARSSPVR